MELKSVHSFTKCRIHTFLGPEATATLISAFVLSRLDYCNAVLAGLPKVTIAPLQRAQNAAARLKGEFNLDIMSQSGYWSYISVNNFHPLVVAFCTLVEKL